MVQVRLCSYGEGVTVFASCHYSRSNWNVRPCVYLLDGLTVFQSCIYFPLAFASLQCHWGLVCCPAINSHCGNFIIRTPLIPTIWFVTLTWPPRPCRIGWSSQAPDDAIFPSPVFFPSFHCPHCFHLCHCTGAQTSDLALCKRLIFGTLATLN